MQKEINEEKGSATPAPTDVQLDRKIVTETKNELSDKDYVTARKTLKTAGNAVVALGVFGAIFAAVALYYSIDGDDPIFAFCIFALAGLYVPIYLILGMRIAKCDDKNIKFYVNILCIFSIIMTGLSLVSLVALIVSGLATYYLLKAMDSSLVKRYLNTLQKKKRSSEKMRWIVYGIMYIIVLIFILFQFDEENVVNSILS